jgi:hypothetical protein
MVGWDESTAFIDDGAWRSPKFVGRIIREHSEVVGGYELGDFGEVVLEVNDYNGIGLISLSNNGLVVVEKYFIYLATKCNN